MNFYDMTQWQSSSLSPQPWTVPVIVLCITQPTLTIGSEVDWLLGRRKGPEGKAGDEFCYPRMLAHNLRWLILLKCEMTWTTAEHFSIIGKICAVGLSILFLKQRKRCVSIKRQRQTMKMLNERNWIELEPTKKKYHFLRASRRRHELPTWKLSRTNYQPQFSFANFKCKMLIKR